MRIIPKNIVRTLARFNNWISKEKLGNVTDLDDAQEYLLNRTVWNNRNYMFNDSVAENAVIDLFEYANDNGYSIEDLIKLSNKSRSMLNRLANF